jgi:hypothetical protein
MTRVMMLLVVSLLALGQGAASLRFATNFGSHMVLQQAPKQAMVWGVCSSTPCSGDVNLDVSSGDAKYKKTYAAKTHDKYWTVTLDALEGSKTTAYSLAVSSGNEKASMDDVLFGVSLA